ncbi:MAG: TIGR03013 family PEP-CTERM/XrtA system glycosyltransferase [Candidatus Accumulibacter sp.]|jgi:sugar transferase (PEP-CTERM system associated)|nr:TIGR03013 family PEP-CTERM/XrtA system glycosyltransferase [Accumulibacter sp.]
MIKVFSHWIHWKTILQVVLDIAFPVVCAALAVLSWGIGGRELKTVIVHASIYALIMALFNYWLGLYKRTIMQKRARAVLSIYLSLPIAYCVFTLFSVLDDDNQKLLLLSVMAALVGTVLLGLYTMYSRAGALMANRVLIFGAGADARTVGRVLRKSAPDVQIAGFYPGVSESEISVPRKLLLSRSSSLPDTASALNVNEIIIAVQERRGGALPLSELLDCKLSGVNVLDLASYFERTLGQIRVDSLKAGWLIFGDGFRQGWLRTFVKRVFDVVAAAALLLIASPIMLVTVLLIVLEDGFPVFYRQERVGLNGRLFNVVKFRSMRRDAESDGKPRWAKANDDRITRVGRVIRKLRIDELPQLFSVLTGDMSLVGPRPERPYFVDKLTRDIPFYAVRHSVKPGVTGWAQVSYHYGSSVNDSIQKLQYDLYYVKNHTLFLDLVILFETVGVVLTGKGAQ